MTNQEQGKLAELEKRVAELEKTLAEEREEHAWDLKAAQETATANQRKLEEEKARLTLEMTRLKRRGPAPAEDVEKLTQRALLAERRVAELEQQSTSGLTVVDSPGTSSKGGSLAEQRAEDAQRKIDKLEREKTELSRKLEEKERACTRAEERAREGRDARLASERLKREVTELKARLHAAEQKVQAGAQAEKSEQQAESRREDRQAELDALQQKIEAQTKELDELREEMARTKMVSGQMLEHREREVERLKVDHGSASEELEQLRQEQGQAREEVRELTKRLLKAEKERDNLQEEVQGVMERVPTAVGRVGTAPGGPAPVLPPELAPPEQEQGAQEQKTEELVEDDPFDEPTQADKKPRGATDSQPPAVSAQMLDSQAEGGFLAPEPGTVPAGKPKGSFAKGSTLIGTGVDQASDAFDLAVGSAAEEPQGESPQEPDEEDLDELEPLEPSAEIEALERPVLDAPLVGEAPENEQDAPPPPADAVDPLAAPAWVVDDGAPQAEAESVPEFPASDGEVPRGGTDVIRRRKPLKGLGRYRGWFIAGGVLAGFVLVIVGAWHFFPIWFGLGAAESSPDAGSPVSPVKAPDAGAVDGGEASAAAPDAGQESSEADGGAQAPTAGDGPADGESAKGDAGDELVDPELALLQQRYKRSKKVAKALRSLRKLIKRKRYSRARRKLSALLKEAPRDPLLHFYSGQVKYLSARRLRGAKKKERYRQAIEDFRQALLLKQDLADAYYEMGGLYMKLGDKENARGALEAFLSLQPKGRKARSIKKVLKRL